MLRITSHLLCLSVLTSLLGCSNTQGGTLNVRLEAVTFSEILATELGRTDDEMDLLFNLSQPEAPDDSFGFTIGWSSGDEGSYTMQSGAGDPELDAGENAHLQLDIEPYRGVGKYTSQVDGTPSLRFQWLGQYEEDEATGGGYQAFFELSSAEGGTCEAEVTAGGLSGSFTCLGMSAVIDGSLEPSGLLELSGSWEGSGNPR